MSFLNKLTIHNLKKAVASHTQATPETATEQSDPLYDQAHHQFMSYHQYLLAVKTACDQFAQHYYGLFQASHTIVHNITLAAINDAASPTTTYTATAAAKPAHTINPAFTLLRDKHQILAGEKEQSIAIALNDHVIKPLTDALAVHDKINKSIDQRNELAKELDYYAGKVNGLIADQHEMQQKHKEVKKEEVEKLARNQKKKDETASMFGIINKQVTDEMETLVKEREELLLGVVSEFEKIEQQVLELYTSAVGEGNEGEPGVPSNRRRANGNANSGNVTPTVVPNIDGQLPKSELHPNVSPGTNSRTIGRSASRSPAPPPGNPPPHPNPPPYNPNT